MTPGQEVRLKSAYIVKCTGCKKNDAEKSQKYTANTTPGQKRHARRQPQSKKERSTGCAHCLQAEVRLLATGCGKLKIRVMNWQPFAKQRIVMR